MPNRKDYSTTLRIIVPVKVRAVDDAQAAVMIDGIINRMGNIVVYDGTPDCHDDSLYGTAERIERDDIEVLRT